MLRPYDQEKMKAYEVTCVKNDAPECSGPIGCSLGGLCSKESSSTKECFHQAGFDVIVPSNDFVKRMIQDLTFRSLTR